MPLSVLKDIRKIYAGLNADEIRGSAHRDVNIGLMTSSDEGHLEMERFLVPWWLDDAARAEALKSVHRVDGTPAEPFRFCALRAGELPAT